MNKILKFFVVFNFWILVIHPINALSNEKIKIGLLVPLSGENKNLGEQIIRSTKMALVDINANQIEIFPRDTGGDPTNTLKSAIELKNIGVKIIIGPVFFDNLNYLGDVQGVTFLSFTNKTIDLPNNVISSGINATSQLKTITKFIESKNIKKTIFLTPKVDYENEIKKGIKLSKIKLLKHHIYDTEPTLLTSQIEKITNYKIRKQNLADEIRRVENSDLIDKEKQLEKLNKRYTIGNVNFDAVIISDFDESLKSVITSLLYTDISPKKKFIITFNQWFDSSLLKEKTIQPIYYPSINKKNLDNFKNKFLKEFNENPNHISLLSYDLVGLIYYLSLKDDLTNMNKLFKGKIGTFEIQNNEINHRLKLYQIKEGRITEIF